MPQDNDKLKKKAQKLLDNNGNLELAKLEATMDIPDKLDEVINSIKAIPVADKVEIPPIPEMIKVQIEGIEVLTLKGDKGESIKGEPGVDGKTPTKEELKSLILPLIPPPKNGKDGTDGISPDPQEVVPLVLKEIKLPEYKEVVLDGRKEIVGKINEGKKNDTKIEAKQVEGVMTKKELDFAIGVLDQRSQFLINKVSNLQATVDAGGSGGGTWGTITGTLSDQTDLQTALDAKADDLTADQNYVTDAQLVVIANTSGTNTGDQVVPDNLTDFVAQTNWRVFYSNGSGDVTELALGADGTYLQGTGVGSAPIWSTPAGSGDVVKVGTPVNNQVGVWTGDGTIEGDAALTYDSTTDTLTSVTFAGNLTGNVTGNASGTAATVTTAAQPAITSLGTLTTLTVDNILINGNDISSLAGTDLTITPLAGQQIVLDGAIVIDAGVVTGATSISSTNFVGALDGAIGSVTPTTIVGTTITANTSILPDANDGAVLGAAGTAWSDLFLAEGGVINWDSGDLTLTQTGNSLALAGGSFTGRIDPRVVTAADDATAVIDVDITDQYQLTAMANATTISTTGTPVAGQKLTVRLKDNATARALTWDAVFRASSDLALPTTTTISKTLYCGFLYNLTDTKWDLVAVLNNF